MSTEQLDLFAGWPPICATSTPPAKRGDLAHELCVSPVEGLPLPNGSAEVQQYGALVDGYDQVRWCVDREAAEDVLEWARKNKAPTDAMLVSRTVVVGPWAGEVA